MSIPTLPTVKTCYTDNLPTSTLPTPVKQALNSAGMNKQKQKEGGREGGNGMKEG